MRRSFLYCHASIVALTLPILLRYKAFKTTRFSASSVRVKSGIRAHVHDYHATNFNVVKHQVLSTGAQNSQTTAKPTTIVIELINQLGNHLAGIAAGRGLQLWLKEEYGIDTVLLLRNSKLSRKLKDTAIEVHQCFPNLRQLNFTQGNSLRYDQTLSRQIELLGGLHQKVLHVKSTGTSDLLRSLSTLSNVRKWNNLTIDRKDDEEESNGITIPFLLVEVFSMFDILIDKYYEEFRRLFEFDAEACCKLKPEPDESVFVSGNCEILFCLNRSIHLCHPFVNAHTETALSQLCD